MPQIYTTLVTAPSMTAVRLHSGSANIPVWARSSSDNSDERQSDELGPREKAFIGGRDRFCLATVSDTGWPYVQFQGGIPGFLRVLGPNALGFDDFEGNRQYIPAGNAAGNDRVALFLMNYVTRERLTIFGRMEIVDAVADDPDRVSSLGEIGRGGSVERVVIIKVKAFDWNCPQHITPRFTEPEFADRIAQLRAQLQASEAENTRLRSQLYCAG